MINEIQHITVMYRVTINMRTAQRISWLKRWWVISIDVVGNMVHKKNAQQSPNHRALCVAIHYPMQMHVAIHYHSATTQKALMAAHPVVAKFLETLARAQVPLVFNDIPIYVLNVNRNEFQVAIRDAQATWWKMPTSADTHIFSVLTTSGALCAFAINRNVLIRTAHKHKLDYSALQSLPEPDMN